MQISRKNFETYFLDYWENSLDESARQELAGFLKANPDLQDEFLDFNESVSVRLNPEEKIEFQRKNALRKPEIIPTKHVDENSYEDTIIAFLEGDMSNDEILEFEEFISLNPHLIKEIDLFKKTFIKVEPKTVFKNKAGLKRNYVPLAIKRFYIYGSAVAAILLLTVVIFNPFKSVDFKGEAVAFSLDLPVPVKPLPVIQPKEVGVYAQSRQSDTKVPVVEMQNPTPTNQNQQAFSLMSEEFKNANLAGESVSRERIRPIILDQLEPQMEVSLFASNFTDINQIIRRTEVSDVFEDMILRDALRAENENTNEKGAFGRIIANLGNQILGSGNVNNSKPSLIAQVTEIGKERISELKEDAPRIETFEEDGKKKTYFTVNENLSIRIHKADKSGKPRD